MGSPSTGGRSLAGGLAAVAVTALLLAHIAAAGHARACSPPTDAGAGPCRMPGPASTYPWSGSVDVPTNAEVRVTWDSRLSTTFRLRADDGTFVPLELAPYRDAMRPVSELSPGARYTYVDLDYASPRPAAGCTPGPDFVELGSFVTGTGPDTAAPAVPVIAEPTCCGYYECRTSACCGPYSYGLRFVRWTTDGPTREELEVDGVSVGLRFGQARVGWGVLGMFGVGEQPDAPPGTFRVRAIDRSGNVSDWSAPMVVGGCPRDPGLDAGSWSGGATIYLCDDAGVRPGMDAGPGVRPSDGVDAGRGAGSPAMGGCGCTAHRGEERNGSVVSILAVALVWRRNRGRS